ncbi:MAG: hypothetical protein AAB116_21600 [Candidatus Poribacteria bacterium]
MKYLLITLIFVVLYVGSVLSEEVMLNANSIIKKSDAGVAVVNDKDASIGKAMEFTAGANNPLSPNPTTYVDMEFTASAGKYNIWLRAKSDGDTSTDSLWIQFDDEIGTDKGDRYPARGLGNWIDVHPAGEYVWASNEVIPPDGPTVVSYTFEKGGKHTLRIQPRQVPHRIDQIWLSTTQDKYPKDNRPVGGFAVEYKGKLAATWAGVKRT